MFALVPMTTIWISLGVGIGLVLSALIGFWGIMDSRRGVRKLLRCNIMLICICLAAQLASVVLFAQTSNLLVQQQRVNSTSIVDVNQIAFNNAILSSYTVCCVGCINCNNVQPFANATTPYCLPPNSCSSVLGCANATTTTANGCYVGNTQGLNTPVLIDKGVCTYFQTTKMLNTFIVSATSSSGCGQGSPGTYLFTVLQYLFGVYNEAFIGLLVLAILQGGNLVVSIGVFYHSKPPPPVNLVNKVCASKSLPLTLTSQKACDGNGIVIVSITEDSNPKFELFCSFFRLVPFNRNPQLKALESGASRLHLETI
jgi:hypothetical protein